MRVADYIIERLYDEGAKHIFMVTGRGILFLSDAVARHKKIKGICVHHEQAGAFAATAYAQCTENVGACLVSTGCAGTNAITGLLNAGIDVSRRLVADVGVSGVRQWEISGSQCGMCTRASPHTLSDAPAFHPALTTP